ncbi:MAG: hypothetical protein ABIK89_21425, partial [Planctomycetota bacterium]
MTRFRCEHCRQSLGVGSAHTGKKVKCPGCGAVVTVPQSDEAGRSGNGSAPPEAGEPANPGAASATVPSHSASTTRHSTLPVRRFALGVLTAVVLAALVFGNNVTRLFVLLIALAGFNGYWLGASRVAAAFGG